VTTAAPPSPELLGVLAVLQKRKAHSRFTKYVQDPVGFISEVLHEFPWSKQREIALSVRDNRHTAVPSAHDTGKSFIAARLAAWWLSVHPAGEAFVVTTAPTFAQVRAILWREINRAHAKGGLPGRVNQTEWHIGNEMVAFGRKPADYDESAFQGIHARYVLVILDEACGIPKQLWDAAETLATNEGCRILAIGNPDTPLSEFARNCERGTDWHVIDVDGLASPNFTDEDVPDEIRPMLISPTWVEERKKAWGEDSAVYQSKVRGKFPKVPAGAVYKELGMHLQWYGALPQFTKLVGGLDFGGANDNAHKTSGVVAGLTPDNKLIRFAHFEDAGAKVHENLVSWMRGIEAKMARRVMWRADKSQSFGISLASGMGFRVEPSHGGADSVDVGITLVRDRMKNGSSYFTEDLLEIPSLDGLRLNGGSWYEMMRKYRWQDQPDDNKRVPGVPLKRDDDTADADRYMHEEADGFPVTPARLPQRAANTNQPLARKAK